MSAPDFRSPPPVPRPAVWLGAAGPVPFAIGAAVISLLAVGGAAIGVRLS